MLVVAVTAVATLAACGSSADSSSGGTKTTKVRFALDWTPNTNHTGLYVALKKGWFKKAGIDVDVLPYSNTSTETILQAGKADFAISFESSAVYAAASGGTNTSVMAVLQHNATALAVLKKRTDLASPKDLEGKTYGNAGSSEAGLRQIKDAIIGDGGKGDFESVTLGTSAYQALYKGKVDFVNAFTTWEGIDAQLKGTPMNYFFLQDYGVPDEYTVEIAGSTPWLKAHPTQAKAFVQALQKGYVYAADHPKEAAQILIDENPGVFEDTKLVFQSQAMISKDYLKDKDGKVGTQTEAMWQNYVDYMTKNKLLVDESGKTVTTAPDVSKLYSNDFISQ